MHADLNKWAKLVRESGAKLEMKPFRLQVPDSALADLRERLAHTRLPDEPPGPPWKTGASLAYVKELLEYWRSGFDWRAQEARINAFPQFKVPIDGVEVHFIHQRSASPDAMPLLLVHGWPGSIVEFLGLIPRLAERFDVVAPSLPGYTLSFAPGQKRFGVEDIASTFTKLMTEVLGYKRFGTQGGDWGAFITSRMAATRPELFTGLHLNYLTVPRDTTAADADWQAQLADWVKERSAYSIIQGTPADARLRPYRLASWPRGVDRREVSRLDRQRRHDRERDRARRHARQHLALLVHRRHRLLVLDLLRAHSRSMARAVPDHRADRLRRFPKEILRPPRAVAEKYYTNIQRWTAMEKGGHFAALEQPQALARDIGDFSPHTKPNSGSGWNCARTELGP